MDTGCFHILATVNSTAVNIKRPMSFWNNGFIFFLKKSRYNTTDKITQNLLEFWGALLFQKENLYNKWIHL